MRTPPFKAFWTRTTAAILFAAIAVSGAAGLFSRPATAYTPIVKNVKPLPLMQESEGRQIFEKNCAQCHGKLADGRDGIGPPLVHHYYRRGHHANIAFYMAAERGVQAHHWPFGDMPTQPQVSPNEMTLVINYLRELQNHNGIY